jgi:ABC-type branched-subunit amino acid transport system ATPase component/ABC-type branched-subunit amino acid transport system permease subunit
LNEVVQFALLGLGTGAIYALLGQGIVVIYRGSGIVNFAQGAMAMVGAFLYWELRTERGWPLPIALMTAVGAIAAVGAMMHLLVMRPMRHSSSLARVIATLGLASVLTAGATLVWGPSQRIVDTDVPRDLWTFDGLGLHVAVGSDRVYLFGIALTLTIGLTLLYRRTAFGRQVTAVAESERGAAMLGISPDRVATVNWAIGGTLAALAGILIVPITGLQVGQLAILVIAALATALTGALRSFWGVLAGGLLIGIIQSELARYGSDLFGVNGQQGVAASLPFIVIVVLLAARGTALPLRSHTFERLPSIGTGHIRVVPLVAAAIAVLMGVLTFFGDELNAAVLTMVIVAIIIVSLVVLTGYAGQISLGQFAFAGMGALIAGRLVSSEGWPFALAVVAGVVTSAAVGLAFALPALRTRGINLAVVTLGLGYAVEQIVFANSEYTGGFDGTPVGRTHLFGWDIDGVSHKGRYVAVCIVCFIAVILIVANVRRGRVGRRMLAVRTNERAAASLGISVFRTKLAAFGLSAAIAGLGGVLLAFEDRTIVYSAFGTFDSINAVLQTVIGGVGYLVGVPVGASFAPGAPPTLVINRILTDPGQWLVLAGGIVVLLTLVRHPDGLGRKLTRRVAPQRPRELLPATDRELEHVRPASLRVRGLQVRIGGALVVRDVDLVVDSGAVVGLIGPNGAGKTMTLDAISGFVRPSGGEVTLDSEVLTTWSPRRRARAGIARSFQTLELFEDISVEENMRVAGEGGDAWSYLRDVAWPRREPLGPVSLTAVRDFALEEDLDRRPDELPYGKRRLVSVARAVATGASIVLLDEPAAGLNTHETEELGLLIRDLATRWGIGILLVEHDMQLVLGVCDRVIVMDAGAVIADGSPNQVRNDSVVQTAYLGDAHTEPVT